MGAPRPAPETRRPGRRAGRVLAHSSGRSRRGGAPAAVALRAAQPERSASLGRARARGLTGVRRGRRPGVGGPARGPASAASHWLARVWERKRSGVHTPRGRAALNSRAAGSSARGPAAGAPSGRAGLAARSPPAPHSAWLRRRGDAPCPQTPPGSPERRRWQERRPAPTEPRMSPEARRSTGRWGPGGAWVGGRGWGGRTRDSATARPTVLQAGHGEAAPRAHQ